MKIRVELTDDDGRKIADVILEGRDWKGKAIQFIEMFGDTQPLPTESSSMPQISNSNTSQQQASAQPVSQMYYPAPNAAGYYPVYWPSFPPQYAPPQIPVSVPLTTTKEFSGEQSAVERPGRTGRTEIASVQLTISERLELFLKYEFPRMWATSQDIQQHYETVYGPIKLSTVSTYLSRMYHKNLVERRGNRNRREYLYVGDDVQVADSERHRQSYLHSV